MNATFGGATVGTPGYMAPEQFDERGTLGPMADLFSLAAIVFYVLTGENLFEGRSAAAAMSAAKVSRAPQLARRADLAFELREREAACQALDLAIARATSLNHRDRPQSGKLFADSLLPWLEPRRQHARAPAGAGWAASRPCARARWWSRRTGRCATRRATTGSSPTSPGTLPATRWP